MQKTILIGVAGLLGTLGRYWLSGFVARQYGETFPWSEWQTMRVEVCLPEASISHQMPSYYESK